MARKTQPQGKTTDAGRELRAALFAMEPELRQIEGMLALLTILGEASDPVKPMGLATLAPTGQSAFDGLSQYCAAAGRRQGNSKLTQFAGPCPGASSQ